MRGGRTAKGPDLFLLFNDQKKPTCQHLRETVSLPLFGPPPRGPPSGCSSPCPLPPGPPLWPPGTGGPAGRILSTLPGPAPANRALRGQTKAGWTEQVRRSLNWRAQKGQNTESFVTYRRLATVSPCMPFHTPSKTKFLRFHTPKKLYVGNQTRNILSLICGVCNSSSCNSYKTGV